jgi:hypothetical protein
MVAPRLCQHCLHCLLNATPPDLPAGRSPVGAPHHRCPPGAAQPAVSATAAATLPVGGGAAGACNCHLAATSCRMSRSMTLATAAAPASLSQTNLFVHHSCSQAPILALCLKSAWTCASSRCWELRSQPTAHQQPAGCCASSQSAHTLILPPPAPRWDPGGGWGWGGGRFWVAGLSFAGDEPAGAHLLCTQDLAPGSTCPTPGSSVCATPTMASVFKRYQVHPIQLCHLYIRH